MCGTVYYFCNALAYLFIHPKSNMYTCPLDFHRKCYSTALYVQCFIFTRKAMIWKEVSNSCRFWDINCGGLLSVTHVCNLLIHILFILYLHCEIFTEPSDTSSTLCPNRGNMLVILICWKSPQYSLCSHAWRHNILSQTSVNLWILNSHFYCKVGGQAQVVLWWDIYLCKPTVLC